MVLVRAERLMVREPEALEMLGIGRTTFLQLVYAGDIPSVKIGRSRCYSVEALREWVRRQEGRDDAAE
ncbi:helix-turn-helix domain-containing protein [Nitrolancea hollandica]|uniref:Excisionase/Xis, DNA-binding n=1 Tax=Nitrolancea hollandica Lb TaxID=1129897 RepID=I4EF98_9BACT|nr:helix-turn-helix domain-containing protein [Nitrolancea hollandica]CCF83360.1 Excisionase/Xis, DNA-binding [Nitrolancea hollandica Lb]